MLALGLLFMIVAAVVTAGAIYDGGEDATFEVLGQTIGTTIGGVFIAGLATMLVFFLGVWMLMRSLARSRRKRHERKETKNRQRESVSQIEEERAKLRAENEQLQERLALDTRPAPVAAATDSRSDSAVDSGTERGTDRTGASEPAPVRPSDGDRIVDHRTDLTSQEGTSTSGRHRDEV